MSEESDMAATEAGMTSSAGPSPTGAPNAGSQTIYFVCGALRSGTTLLRLMLNNHPRLSNPAEMDFLFEPPRLAQGGVDMGKYRRRLEINPVVRGLELSIDPALDYPELVLSLVGQLGAPGARLSINVHRNFERIPALFPQARYIHLLRDPRDVARSSIGMGWAGNVYYGVGHWIDTERSFERLRANVPPECIHALKYENLVLDPGRELGALCEFMGVSFAPAMLTYPDSSTYNAPDRSLVQQWKREQSREEVALVEGRIGDMLTARGYEPSGFAPITPSPWRRFALAQQNRLGRWRFSAKRYGPGLTALNALRRYIPHDGLDHFVSARLNEKAERYRK